MKTMFVSMESGLASLTHLFFHKAGDKAQRHDMLFSSFAAELHTITLIIWSLFFLNESVCSVCEGVGVHMRVPPRVPKKAR